MEFHDVTLLIIGAGALIAFLQRAFIVPKLPEATLSTLMKAAHIAVYAAEAIWGRGFGEEKAREALGIVEDFLARFKIKFDIEAIMAAIDSEWKKMDQDQIAKGIKVPEGTDS